jgi:hypothetical protein
MIFTPAVRFLVLSNIAFLLGVILHLGSGSVLALWPLCPRFYFWQLHTYAVAHGGSMA